jgi:hypothetical protein
MLRGAPHLGGADGGKSKQSEDGGCGNENDTAIPWASVSLLQQVLLSFDHVSNTAESFGETAE